MRPEIAQGKAEQRTADEVPGRIPEGCRALVTGSTGGLGLAIAEGLARAGASVMLHGLDDGEKVEPLRHRLAEAAGTEIAYHCADLSSQAGVDGLVDNACRRLGGIDILVNNAVVRHFAPIVDFPGESWETSLAVNLSAPFYAIRRLLPSMRQSNYGRIFNITSVYGLRGTTDRVGYVATKSGLLGLTRAVALENLDRDVTCHCICPGSVLTPGTEDRVTRIMTEQNADREQAERIFLEGKQPGGSFVPPQSVSALLVFLCGPVARDMTGAMLPVEGGWLAS
ncbi:SDR family NAD(P)-dependent oxidoreductase [Marinibaculum pumilum]|uniref:SDR family NAD(P)-dependent oxidoreductase n=1 Tax=Marinibaculum pumilum TaxID=1766165 RepID=A0ABV7KW54_9PROT